MNKNFFYNGRKMLSYNCLYNFLIGNRGGGKTYWCKDYAIKDYLKNGKQFIYLRRFDSEFDEGKKEKFLEDIEHTFEGHVFKIKGYTLFCDKKPMGFFCALSKGQTFKSVPFPNVDKIIYDEFIIDKKSGRRYISDEITTFLDFYETVARLRNDVRVFFVANSVSMMNPYFAYFKIFNLQPKGFKRFGKEILVETIANEKYIEAKKNTRFGQIIKGTAYEKYSVENNFLRDNSNTMIGKKSGKAHLRFTLKYLGKKYGVWIDYSIGKYIVSNSINGDCPLNYAVTLDDHTENTLLTKGSKSYAIGHFIDNFKIGNVLFETVQLKAIFLDIIRLFLI